MKKLFAIIAMVLCLTVSSCSGVFSIAKKIIIPDMVKVDEASAKLAITQKGLLPVAEYEYSDNVNKGCVVRTDPSAGEAVDEDTKVTLFISLGPAYIAATDATISWYSIDSESKDDWNFSGLEIYEGNLYIYCETVFGTDFSFKGTGFGNASLTDTFDKEIPLRLIDEKMNDFPEGRVIKAGDTVKFYIKVSLNQLETERPTHLACEIVYLKDGKEGNIRVSFNASWE